MSSLYTNKVLTSSRLSSADDLAPAAMLRSPAITAVLGVHFGRNDQKFSERRRSGGDTKVFPTMSALCWRYAIPCDVHASPQR